MVLGCAALAPWVLRARLEGRLSQATSTLLGIDVIVYCQSFGEAFIDTGAELGYVAFGPDGVPERSTLIKREQCHDLRDYLRSPPTTPTQEQAVAVHTLTHEAMHMGGNTSESETECLAVQRDAEMARLLGAEEQAARNLAVLYWQRHYPLMPGDYRSAECGPGGALDINSPDAPWR
jgi:hypothetical protein